MVLSNDDRLTLDWCAQIKMLIFKKIYDILNIILYAFIKFYNMFKKLNKGR